MVLPQDQTIKADPTVTEANSSPSSDFSPPSGWGKTVADSTPKIVIPEYPNVDDQYQNDKKESGLVKFVKIFLIAVALILLGVLLGILASSFLGGTGPVNNAQTPTPTIPTASPSSQAEPVLEQILEPEYSKKIEYRNNGAGPYSFDILVTDDWKIATKSTDKNNINIVLNTQNIFVKFFYNPTTKAEKPEICLLTEEVAPKNVPYLKYNQYKESKVGELNWRLVKDLRATESASYLICEQNSNNQFVSLTSVGFVTTGKNNGNEIDTTEENKILNLFKGLKILNPISDQCVNDYLNVKIKPLDGWKCASTIENNEGWIKVSSSLFTVNISNAGRGPFCGDGPDPDNKCMVTEFFSNNNVSTSLYTYNKDNGEIWGSIIGTKLETPPWISITYTDIGKKSLSLADKNKLILFLNSIEVLKK